MSYSLGCSVQGFGRRVQEHISFHVLFPYSPWSPVYTLNPYHSHATSTGPHVWRCRAYGWRSRLQIGLSDFGVGIRAGVMV